MARTKEQKKEIIERVNTIADGAKTLVFVNIHGLKVGDAVTMRRALSKEGVGFFVAKKTLAERVLETKKYQGSVPALMGELALAYGTDLVAPARGVYEFQKKLKGAVSIVGGVFENKYMNKEEMTAIAAIPPLQTLYGLFVNVINSPIKGLVMTLDQISRKKSA
ncbi:MAG: large subunit ribosomal protein [Candidatus Parcubacteria bacterium]|jgi:large subunit ribosomal protein L10|nr:large subunit ribosomal protein [Candidatus Parcubacteria bacterium]